MRMKRTIHTEKAQAEERAAEALEIAADTAKVEDDAERDRAQREARETAQAAREAREADRIAKLKREVHAIIDARERALRAAKEVVEKAPGTCTTETRLVEFLIHRGFNPEDAALAVKYDGGMLKKMCRDETGALVVKR